MAFVISCPFLPIPVTCFSIGTKHVSVLSSKQVSCFSNFYDEMINIVRSTIDSYGNLFFGVLSFKLHMLWAAPVYSPL